MFHSTKSRRIFAVLILIMASFFIYVISDWRGVDTDLPLKSQPLADICNNTSTRHTSFDAKAECLHSVYRQRRYQYEYVCKTFRKGDVVRIYQTGHTAYCQVPKVGSTFWLSVYYFLNEQNGATYSSPFDIPRHDVHYNMTKGPSSLAQPGVAQQINTSYRFMFVREPFSRLLSAYIDKILLPDFWTSYGKKLMTFLHRRPKACPSNISFEQFVQFVVLKDGKGQEIGDHWRPIHELCNPCLFRPLVVGKMESFAEDSQHVLSAMNVSWVTRGLEDRDKRVHRELDMLVDFNVALLEVRDVFRCTNLSGIVQRLWTAFQLNGYIPTEVTLPRHFLTSPATSGPERDKKAYTERFKRFVHEAYESARNRTKEAWKRQRETALVEAYRTIGDDLMRGLQKMYEYDFKLFGYDPKPDILFRDREAFLTDV